MQYDANFKLEALRLSDDIGTKNAAEQLGIPKDTLSSWRFRRSRYGETSFVGSGHRVLPADEKSRRIQELERELRELRRSNEILKEALGFFAGSRKK